ncbi:MAG TPA: 16S rRNA (adenine(1518)-N(6)/adenine(1519)-N(6))-dimethyltransferase RsmA [Acidobacteriaceae bacterium]|jgi:16S rRNA (adenine1518-N6/adenine1519-N6)-dimethyltransferase|nr:16S rRNA (adenine(1518)-N(6)/adenine(1519)-N(6))-dimethyltransferase RsmA [Acidobacteriaceae bacterium]
MPQRPQRPKLGQNFLVSPTAQAAIADALGDLSHRSVVEIGPGRGAITGLLAPRARRLILIELDHDLAARLRTQFADRPSVEVLEQNILATDLAALRTNPEEKLQVVGNLPYYITSDILLHLFRAHAVMERAVIMTQREVADRIAARPGTRDYGLLSVTAQLYARVENLFTLPPGAFSPPPQVHSTVLRLTMAPRFAELGVEAEPFLRFVRSCFAQKRKMLARNLRNAGLAADRVMAAIEKAGVSASARAEELGVDRLAALWRELADPPQR